MKKLLSWLLVPMFVCLCSIYALAVFRGWNCKHRIRRTIDRFVEWNDRVLMGAAPGRKEKEE